MTGSDETAGVAITDEEAQGEGEETGEVERRKYGEDGLKGGTGRA